MRRQRAASLAFLLIGVACAAIAIVFFAAAALRDVERVQVAGEATLMLAPTMESPLPTPQPAQEFTLGGWSYRFVWSGQALAHGRAPMVGDFLPDNRTLMLIVAPDGKEQSDARQVALLDGDSGSLTNYLPLSATEPVHEPAWLESLQKMAVLSVDKDRDPQVQTIDVNAARAGKASIETMELAEVGAMSGRGAQLFTVERTTGRVLSTDMVSGRQETLIDNLRKLGLDPADYWLKMLTHPKEPLVAIFGRTGMAVLDTSSGKVRTIPLGSDDSEAFSGNRWILNAQWNPSNAELALEIAVGDPPLDATRLFILDTATGEIGRIPIPRQWVMDMAWAPHGEQLLVLGLEHLGATSRPLLVDTDSMQFLELDLWPPVVYEGLSRWSVAWSVDGSRFAVMHSNGVTIFDVVVEEGEHR